MACVAGTFVAVMSLICARALDAAISKLHIRQSQYPKELHKGSSQHFKATLKETRLDLEYLPSTNATLTCQID
jgi:hypothetical protein